MSDTKKQVKAEVLQSISSAVQLYCDNNQIGVYFQPRARYGGQLMPELDFGFIYNERRITDTGLCRLMTAYYFTIGMIFTTDQMKSAVWNYVWERYLREFDYPEHWKLMPRIVIKKPIGRPRKDGTTRTLTIKTE